MKSQLLQMGAHPLAKQVATAAAAEIGAQLTTKGLLGTLDSLVDYAAYRVALHYIELDKKKKK